MRYEFQKIRCQRCGAVNALGQELCDRCGTRLMLVVEPSGLRFEEEPGSDPQATAVLLERLTLFEGGLNRFADKLERGFELMLQQTRMMHREHLLLEALVEVLARSGVLSGEDLEKLLRASVEGDKARQAERELHETLRAQILASHEESDGGEFARLVGNGFELWSAGDFKGGLKALERAAAQSGSNFPLQTLLGEHFFKEGREALALGYLTRALLSNPKDARVKLLLGISLADSGDDPADARGMIASALKRGGESFAGRYALGRLDAIEDDWVGALAEFRRAHAARPCAEGHFLLGLANFKLTRLRIALRHARQALSLDDNYAEAYLLLGVILRRQKEHAAAREALARAAALRGDGGSSAGTTAKGKRVRRDPEQLLLHAVFGASRQGVRGLLTAGDPRLARLLREDALAFDSAAR